MDTDTVFVDDLQLSACIGPDCWGRVRPQPVLVSVYLHLQPSYLDLAGESDDVRDSIHYGHLSKRVFKLIAAPDTQFANIVALAQAVSAEALLLSGEAAAKIRVIVEAPKMMLLASGFGVELTSTLSKISETKIQTRVFVKDMTLLTIIGVNPPERERRQRVITNISFNEISNVHDYVDYVAVVSKISKVNSIIQVQGKVITLNIVS